MIHYNAWQPPSNFILAFMQLKHFMKASHHFKFMTITSHLYAQKLNYACLANTLKQAKMSHFNHINLFSFFFSFLLF